MEPEQGTQKDEDLIALVAKGNEEAFGILLGRYERPIVSLIYRSIGDFARAEEIAQEVFLRIFKNAASFDPAFRFSTWLYSIAKNHCKNELRDRSRTVEHYAVRDEDWTDDEGNGELSRAASKGPTPDQIADRQELKKLIEEALGQLEQNQRMALVMNEYQGLGYVEIAEIFGCPQGTVKSWIHRARQHLLRLLKEKEVL